VWMVGGGRLSFFGALTYAETGRDEAQAGGELCSWTPTDRWRASIAWTWFLNHHAGSIRDDQLLVGAHPEPSRSFLFSPRLHLASVHRFNTGQTGVNRSHALFRG